MVALVAALALALPSTGVAVQDVASVRLVALDGRVVRRLPDWRIAPAFGTRAATVYLRDPGRRVWRLRGGRLTLVARVPRVRISGGCFSTAPRVRICGYPYGSGRSRIVRSSRIVRGSGRAHGHWLSVDVSASGRLLAQWSGECESPAAYVGAGSGLRAVASPKVESLALGWAGERAVVAFPVAACAAGVPRAGIYVGGSYLYPLHRGELAALWR